MEILQATETIDTYSFCYIVPFSCLVNNYKKKASSQ